MSVLPFKAADADRRAPGEGRRAAHGRTQLLQEESHVGSGRTSAASDWAGGGQNNRLYVIRHEARGATLALLRMGEDRRGNVPVSVFLGLGAQVCP